MTKKMIAIWAQDEKGLIGKGASLPWSLPADLAHFKKTTTGHVILMGRITFEGMGKRALPNRHTLVLTRDSSYQVNNERVTVVHSIEEVLSWYERQDKKLFVIGGSQIFKAFEPFVEELIVTAICGQFEGDVFFPEDFSLEAFDRVSETFRSKDSANPFDFTITTYERRER